MSIEPILPIMRSEPPRLVLFIIAFAIKFGEMNLAIKIRVVSRGFGSLPIQVEFVHSTIFSMIVQLNECRLQQLALVVGEKSCSKFSLQSNESNYITLYSSNMRI